MLISVQCAPKKSYKKTGDDVTVFLSDHGRRCSTNNFTERSLQGFGSLSKHRVSKVPFKDVSAGSPLPSHSAGILTRPS